LIIALRDEYRLSESSRSRPGKNYVSGISMAKDFQVYAGVWELTPDASIVTPEFQRYLAKTECVNR
jgi:hypothetical protein